MNKESVTEQKLFLPYLFIWYCRPMPGRASRFPGVSAYIRILLVRTCLLGGGTGLYLHVKKGTWWRSWLSHCTTSRKVVGSIPDGVIGFFN